MAEYSVPEERTEMPTGRRMGELRKKGAIHMSEEVVKVVSLMSGFLMLGVLWSHLFEDFKIVFRNSFQLIERTEPLSFKDIQQGAFGLMLLIGPHVGLLVVVVAASASLAVMLQTDWNVRERKIEWKFNLLNPWSGISRIFSIQGLVNTLKALFKLCILLPIGYFVLKGFAPEMIGLIHTSVPKILQYCGKGIHTLFWKFIYVLVGFALFDYFWGKYMWLRNNKMTKDEVKDERKAIEGDETTRKKIQHKGLQRIAQRLYFSVPKADVVVTNPEHIAVALKYDRDNMAAPTVVAKGQDHLAQQIKKIARQAGVPVVERKPLARALYASVNVGHMIPRDLFRAVAEVFAYVYRIKNPHKAQGAGV